MDGLRKVPDNVPNKAMLAEDIGKPLTWCGTLRDEHLAWPAQQRPPAPLLDGFGFEYEFLSGTECYRAGRFDAKLMGCCRSTTR